MKLLFGVSATMTGVLVATMLLGIFAGHATEACAKFSAPLVAWFAILLISQHIAYSHKRSEP